MIIVQDKERRVIYLCTTITIFLNKWHGNGASINSYDYIRKRIKVAGDGNTIKYKMFFITKMKPERGKRRALKNKFLEPIM